MPPNSQHLHCSLKRLETSLQFRILERCILALKLPQGIPFCLSSPSSPSLYPELSLIPSQDRTTTLETLVHLQHNWERQRLQRQKLNETSYRFYITPLPLSQPRFSPNSQLLTTVVTAVIIITVRTDSYINFIPSIKLVRTLPCPHLSTSFLSNPIRT